MNEQRELPRLYLFPEVAEVETQSRLSEIVGRRFTSIRNGLEIADNADDFYALRRTYNSRMTAAGVAHADCQAMLGHKHGDITSLHYTDRKLKRAYGLRKNVGKYQQDRQSAQVAGAGSRTQSNSRASVPSCASCSAASGRALGPSRTSLPPATPTTASGTVASTARASRRSTSSGGQASR